MMTSIQGVYREGRIELAESPANVSEGTLVIVTFLSNGDANLADRGIGPAQAAELRARLASFAEEWESSEMNAYDNDHAAKSNS
jgi:hypothetical protein